MYLARAWARASAIGIEDAADDGADADDLSQRLAASSASVSQSQQPSSVASHKDSLSSSSRRRSLRHGCATHREGAFVAAFSGAHIAIRELGPRGRALGEWRAEASDAFVGLAWQEDAPDDDVDDLQRLRHGNASSSAVSTLASADVEERVMARVCAITSRGEAHALRATLGRTPASGEFFGDVELERVLVLDDDERAMCIASDEREFVLGTDRGRVVFIDWEHGTETRAADVRHNHRDAGVATSIDWCARTSTCVVRFKSGAVCVAVIDARGDVSASNWIDAFPCPSTCAAFHRRTRALALGTADGEIRIYSDAMTAEVGKPKIVLSLRAFGFGVEDTGSAAYARWSNDGVALAVGWRRRGVSVWSDAGCLLMCSLHHGGGSSSRSDSRAEAFFATDAEDEDEPEIGACLGVPAWGVGGFSVFFACLVDGPRCGAKLFEYSLARNIPAPRIRARTVADETAMPSQVSGDEDAHVLLADDRAFVIRTNASGKLYTHQAVCPAAYVDAHWPMRLACTSTDGSRIAVAGARGCVVYNARDEKWTMFGGVAEENEFEALALAWINVSHVNVHSPILAVAARFGKPRMFSKSLKVSYRVQFYSRDRLGGSAMLGSMPLPAEPMHMSACGSHFLVAFDSGEIAVYKLDMHGDEGAVHPVRESSGQRRMTTLRDGRALIACALEPDIAGDAPREALVLTSTRELVLVDLTDNHAPVTVLRDVTNFWVSPRACESSSRQSLDEDENSSGLESDDDFGARVTLGHSPVDHGCIFAYGADGMRICYFPRDGARQIFRHGAACIDVDHATKNPELEFDRELYPVQVSVRLSRIVGVAQKLSFSDASEAESPYFSIAPKSHTIVPCVLRKLLSAGSHVAAVRFARAARRQTPHFTHALEWLLFTALESANRDAVTHTALKQSLALLRELPNYLDIVVSVARKTDNTRWRALFAAAGTPSDLCRRALKADRLRIAACYILVIDKLEGDVVGRTVAIEIMREALAAHDYRLVEDVIKFLLKPLRATASENADSTAKPGLLGRVLKVIVPPPNSVLSLGARADRELALDAPEQEILKTHLDILARDKDIINMGAFISDTSFDGVGYFTHETNAGGSAYIDNFSIALESAAKSLRRRAAERREKATPSVVRRRRGDSKDSLLAGDAFDVSTSSTDTARANALLDAARTARCTDWSLLIATALGRADALEDMFRTEHELLKPWSNVCGKCAESSGDEEFMDFLQKIVDDVEAACERHQLESK